MNCQTRSVLQAHVWHNVSLVCGAWIFRAHTYLGVQYAVGTSGCSARGYEARWELCIGSGPLSSAGRQQGIGCQDVSSIGISAHVASTQERAQQAACQGNMLISCKSVLYPVP